MRRVYLIRGMPPAFPVPDSPTNYHGGGRDGSAIPSRRATENPLGARLVKV
jgi:hypothetical protein